jgi:Flp pilus assembly protein TadD
VASDRGEEAASDRYFDEALAHYRAAGDSRGEAVALGDLGTRLHNRGNLAEARTLYLESLRLRRRLSDRYGIAVMLNNLGEILEATGETEAAAVFFTHAERAFREMQAREVDVPAEGLRRLAAAGLDWQRIHAAAAVTPWESLIGQTTGPGP